MSKSNINLLPTDIVLDNQAVRVTKVLRVVAVFLGSATLALGFVIAIYFFYKGKTLTELQTEYSTLKNEVVSLEGTENSLVLVRDRLTKLKVISEKNNFNKFLSVTDEILSSLPTGITLQQLVGDPERQLLTFNATDSTTMEEFIDSIKLKNNLNNLNIKSAGVNVLGGYDFTIEILNI